MDYIRPPTKFTRRNQEERLRTRIMANIDELVENAEHVINSESHVLLFQFRLAFEDHADWYGNQQHNLLQLRASDTRFRGHLEPIADAIEQALAHLETHDPETLRLAAQNMRNVIVYSRTLRGITAVICGHRAIQDTRQRDLTVDALRQTAELVCFNRSTSLPDPPCAASTRRPCTSP